MQSDLIIRENELLNPDDYPEDQRKLVIDFNQRIKDCMGIVTGLSKEYHTIWIVNLKTMKMRLYRTTGQNTAGTAVELALRYDNYNRFIREYVDRYVVDRVDSLYNDVQFSSVVERIGRGDLYTVDYMRMSDEGDITYHQMAFALSDEPGKADSFVLAYKDIDQSIRKHIADKRYLREQLDIVETLSRDYYNIFKINPVTGSVVILKLDGYVTKGMDRPSDKEYSYDALCRQYVHDRVYKEDQPAMYEAMCLEKIIEKTAMLEEYVSSYRVMDKGEIHYYQFTYIPINPHRKDSDILAGFKNVDDIVESSREREHLEILANMDIMTGILNRGSGERKVIDAMANGANGMFCIMDIDNFKSINDTYGHDVGDKVICGIAKILNNGFRERDIVFRLGGDEYAIFLNGLESTEDGNVIINRIFKKIEAMDINELEGKKVTVSAGAAMIDPEKKLDFKTIYKHADVCVYESKKEEGSYLIFHEDSEED